MRLMYVECSIEAAVGAGSQEQRMRKRQRNLASMLLETPVVDSGVRVDSNDGLMLQSMFTTEKHNYTVEMRGLREKVQTKRQTPWPLVRKRTIPTERPPLVDEI
jgi:hypothetical protein